MVILMLYWVVLTVPLQVHALQRFYLEEECGGTIVMDDGNIPAGRLAVTRRSKYRSAFSCHVTIIAPEQQRLVIVFREMDIELEVKCDDDFVQFFDGPTKSSPILSGLKTRLCGHKPPIGNYVTTGNTLTVYFQSDIYKQEDGFEIVFTAFHTAPHCLPGEFRCANGRCIALSLECDDFNNCGDHSDECKVDSEVLLALILSVFLLTIVATGVFMLMRKKKKISKLRKVKQALAGAFRVHPHAGGVTITKEGTVVCSCNKVKLPPAVTAKEVGFRQYSVQTASASSLQRKENMEKNCYVEEIDFHEDGTQLIDAKKLMDSETNQDLFWAKQTWARKTM